MQAEQIPNPGCQPDAVSSGRGVPPAARWLWRARLHGRGGHGVKTAGRIVGTAAFLSGYQVQDAPIYGAERRGAAVASFVRISNQAILERGPIGLPDVIILADETLLDDPLSGVLAGQHAAAGLFVNSPDAASLAAAHQIVPPVQWFDISGRTKEVLGRASAVSAGLGAAAARLTGLVPREQLLDAVRDELTELDMPAATIDQNLQIAGEVFDALQPVVPRERPPETLEAIVEPTQHAPRVAAPSILQPGNAVLRNTGAWRVDRPVPDLSACTRCGLCFVMCPDGAIQLDEHGYPVIDYEHCKGCMICQRLCPIHAIQRQPETRAW